jgi:HD-GYP domain-containing protein (c-di-GMP phosphodiesterase class II)
VQLGRRLGMDNEQLENVRRGAQLHDIGKMGIPDQILFKPGPLTEEEWAVMRRHPVYAYEMLRPFPQFRDIVDIPYCHHEKWDGTGYPRALNSDRPYRPAWPRHQVLEYIYNESGRHFDPEVAAEFLNLVTELPCIEG